MKRVSACMSLWLVIANSVVTAGDSALSGHHPLTQTQAGDVLVSELRCAACHSGVPRGSLPEKSAPDLAAVGARIAPDYLRRYLASPSAAHPGTTMPDVLVWQPEAERDRIAEALTHFLIAQSKTDFTTEATEPMDRQQGQTLFHSVGCVACHGPKEAPPLVKKRNDENDEDEDKALVAKKAIKPNAIPLGHVAAKYSAKSLGEFLFQPLRVRSSGRMPDMKLTPAESLAIAGYLVGEQPQPAKALVPQESLVTQGKKHFQELNCAACHSLPGITAAPLIGSLRTADLTRGCLSKTSVRSPRFQLDEAQVKAIVAALREEPTIDSDKVVAAKTLTAFHCIACHVRDDFGGVHDIHNPFFAGSELKLGDDGRIPPPLTLVGAKLQPVWMKKVLFDGESVRHYMATRMPQYGTVNLQHLLAVFTRLDVLKGTDLKIPSPESRSESEREREKLLRAAGRELLGDKGLNCIACHNFNGKAALVNQGIDLLTSSQRLQPGWFNSYLRDPVAFRPRTVMPTAWPNGIASHKTILDGNTERQIEAIWYYLSLGTSAADPSGLRAVSTKLTVDDQAKTYRGRSRVAVGTRHGEIFLIDGVDAVKPTPSFHRFATGLDEIFGLAWKDKAFRVTQSCELTRVSDSNGDGVANRFETISDAWGYANYHEYAFGSKLDADGNQFVSLGLSESYYSHALNRGFIMKVSPDGKTIAFASGLRSPGWIGHDEHGALFYVESQGPWNCSCSLKAVSQGSFHGHPASFEWYKHSPELGPVAKAAFTRPRPQRDVCDVSHPHFIDPDRRGTVCQHVRVVPQTMATLRRTGPKRLRLNRLQPPCFQESGHTRHSTRQSLSRQLDRDATRPVTTMMMPEDLVNERPHFLVVLLSQRLFLAVPRIEARPAHRQDIAHRRGSIRFRQHNLVDQCVSFLSEVLFNSTT